MNMHTKSVTVTLYETPVTLTMNFASVKRMQESGFNPLRWTPVDWIRNVGDPDTLSKILAALLPEGSPLNEVIELLATQVDIELVQKAILRAQLYFQGLETQEVDRRMAALNVQGDSWRGLLIFAGKSGSELDELLAKISTPGEPEKPQDPPKATALN